MQVHGNYDIVICARRGQHVSD